MPDTSSERHAAGGDSVLAALLAPRLGPGELALLAYVVAVVSLTVLQHLAGVPGLRFFTASPDAVAHGRWWTLITSGFLITTPMIALQAVAVLVLGLIDLRLCGARLFWTVVLVVHVGGTLVVYSAVWLIGDTGLAGVAAVSREPDYGISLVWFAGGCVLAMALARLAWAACPRTAWRALIVSVLVAAPLIAIPLDRSGHYQHAIALPLSYLVVLMLWRTGPSARRDRAGLTAVAGRDPRDARD